MASPTYRSLSKNFQFTGSNNVTTGNGSDPTGAASGDGLVMVVLMGNTNGGGHGTVTGPTGGWTFHGSVVTGQFDVYVWSIRRGGSAANYTCSWTTGQLYSETYVIAASGVVGSGSVLDSITFGTPGTSATVDPPSNTLLTVDTLSVAIANSWAGWTSAATPPTGYTDRSSGSQFDVCIATKATTATGAENPSAFSNADASDAQVGITLAFASVAGGTTYDVTPSDTAVLTDACALDIAYGRGIDETVSVTDTLAAVGRFTDVVAYRFFPFRD